MATPDISHDQILERAQLLEENEQLRTSLESALEENARLEEDRTRLLGRVAAMARDLRLVVGGRSHTVVAKARNIAARERLSEAEEELRVSFEELQVLTEELEIANTGLIEANNDLDRRVGERTRQITAVNQALRVSEVRFRTLAEGIPEPVWRAVDGGRWTWASPQWTEYTGLSNEASRMLGWLRALHPDDRDAALSAWNGITPGDMLHFEARIFHVAEQRYRHFRVRARAARGDDGQLIEWLGTASDVDDLMTLQRRQEVLVAELQHRTRNLMAVVQAVAVRTVRGVATLDDFWPCFNDRLQALARVQTLLSNRTGDARVTIDALIRAELAAHVALDAAGHGTQVRIGGPADIPLKSSGVQTLALALHELASNAARHGALSVPAGLLEVRWWIGDEDRERRLHIDWRETGVTGATAPARRGYGMELIERALPYQLGAQTSHDFTDQGVHCTIVMPVAVDRPPEQRDA